MALYEGHVLLLLVPRTVSILSSSTPIIYTFRCVTVRNEGCITKGVNDDGDRTPNHQVL
jgi:hypothetical protein